MGTLWTITVYCGDKGAAEAAFSGAFDRLAGLDRVMSDYIPDSEVRGIGGDWTRASRDLAAVLLRARHAAESSGGAFDPVLGRVTKLWRRALRKKILPSPEELVEARENSGFELLEYEEEGRKFRLTKPGARIDLGGIGKGYALGVVGRFLREEHAIPSFLIDAGGDVYAGAAPKGTAGWRVEVRGCGKSFSLTVSDRAVATSGDLHQYAEIGGVRYSHIIDPRSGRAVIGGAAATVVAEDPTAADALASALCVIKDRSVAEACIAHLAPGAALRVARDGAPAWEEGMSGFRSRSPQEYRVR